MIPFGAQFALVFYGVADAAILPCAEGFLEDTLEPFSLLFLYHIFQHLIHTLPHSLGARNPLGLAIRIQRLQFFFRNINDGTHNDNVI